MQSLKVFSNIYRLALPLLILISLLVGTVSYALIGSASADSKELEYSVNILPVLNVTIPTNTVSLNLHPNNKTFDSSNFNITVSTNNAYGYNLSMSSTGTSLINAADSSITLDTLPASETGYTDTTFPTNAWGYKLGSSNWTPYTSGVTLLENNAPTYGDSTNISFGAKIDYDQPAGNYNLALTFTAVAGVAPVSYMQDFTVSEAESMAEGDTRELVDSRDGESYKIAKLADGKVWMLDNLRLGSTDITTDLTSANTNLSSTISASTWNGYRKTSGFSSYTTPMFNSASANNTITSYGSGSGKIGVYYNYCVASAGTYCYTEGSGTGNASYDICPKGWRMPTGGSSGEYRALYTAYLSNATNNFRNALSTPLSGYFDSSSASSQDSSGSFWSSTYYNGYGMYRLIVGSSSVGPTSNGNRDYGYSVRCLLK